MPNGFHPDCACKADPPAFQGIISPFSYAYPVDQLIKRFKEQGHLAAGKLVPLQLAEHLRSEPLKIDRLIPIPIHPFKRLKRGFNQCDLICKDLSQALAIPWSRRHLRSQRLTPPRSKPFGPANEGMPLLNLSNSKATLKAFALD